MVNLGIADLGIFRHLQRRHFATERGPVNRSKFLVVLTVFTFLSGCSPIEEPERKAASAPKTEQPVTSSKFPSVLSEKASDSGRTLAIEEIQAELLVDGGTKPEGFRYNSVIVDEGLGSFRIATPKTYTVPWRFGTSPDELFAVAGARDEAWVGFWKDRVADDDNPRAISIDSTIDDDVVGLLITLTPSPGVFGKELAELFADMYGEIWDVAESHSVRVNGADGAYVEHTVPAATVGGAKDRVQLQVLIPDQANDVLWGVTCDVPPALVERVKPLCAEMAATFQPLPAVKA